MTDPKEIEIAQIEQIRSIYIYKVNTILKGINEKKYLIGIKIAYKDYKELSYDYRSPYFEQFLNKVLECYVDENKKALLFGDLTNELLSDLLDKTSIEENEVYCKEEIIEKNFLYRDIMKNYLYEIVKNFLSLHIDKNSITLNGVSGIREKLFVHYSYQYENNDKKICKKDSIIPIILVPQSKNKYHFVARLTEFLPDYHDLLDICEGYIQMDFDNIYIHWQSKATSVENNSLYSSEKKYNESTLTYGDKTILFNQEKKEISINEKELLDAYIKLFFDINYNNFKTMKILNDHYLVYIEKDCYNSIKEKHYVYFVFLNDTLYVTLNSFKGKEDSEKTIFIPIHSKEEHVIATNLMFKEFMTNNGSNLFIQHQYLEPNCNEANYKYFLINNWNIKELKNIPKYNKDDIKNITSKVYDLNETKHMVILKKVKEE